MRSGASGGETKTKHGQIIVDAHDCVKEIKKCNSEFGSRVPLVLYKLVKTTY